MKKLIYLFAFFIAFVTSACSGGGSVDKEVLMQKLKDRTELTQKDYADLIKVLDTEVGTVLKWHSENPDVKWKDTPAEIKKQSEDVLYIALELQEAAGDDKLDNSNKRKFVKVMEKASEVVKK